MAKKTMEDAGKSTEEKFKEAARTVFTKKGYAGTRTRDIAEEAGLNLALLNYYFRSKEKLFEIVMAEKIQQLFATLAPFVNDETATLQQKLERISEKYIEMLSQNPDLPLFVLSEIRNNPKRFGKSVQLENYFMKSHFMKQLVEQKKDINPIHFFMTFLGMLIFPFIAGPVLQATGSVNEKGFAQIMEERKALIPGWMKLILK